MQPQSKILIVEDEYIVAEDIANILTNAGYKVVAKADRASEAIALTREHRPDLILMDIVLKGTDDGITAAHQIRQETGTPVVYLTAYSDRRTFERAKETQPLGYIVKPFDEANLKTSVEIALERARLEFLLRHGNQWLSTLLRSLSDGVVAIDLKGRVQFINRAANRLLHPNASMDPDELIDLPILDIQGLPSSIRSIIQDQPRIGDAAEIECVRRWTPGDTESAARPPEDLPVAIQVFSIQNAEGTSMGSLVRVRDITLELQNRDRERRDRERLEGLVASRTDKLLRQVRREQLAATISERFQDLGDRPLDEIVSFNLDRLAELIEVESVSILHLDSSGLCKSHWQNQSSPSPDATPETSVLLPDLLGQRILPPGTIQTGDFLDLIACQSSPSPLASILPESYRPTRALLTAIPGPTDESFLFAFLDRTTVTPLTPIEKDSIRGLGNLFTTALARLIAEKRQHELRERLEQAQRLESIGKLASGLAHDFKNYLTPIMGFADLIKEDVGFAAEGAVEIKKAANAAEGLISQLLAFSREQELEQRDVCLYTLLRDMEPLLRRVAGSGRRFECDFPPTSSLIRADIGQLKQVVMNLVTNARQATPRGGSIHLRLKESQDDQTMRIHIEDTGCGIPPAALQRIFEPFYSTKGDDGTGLGLSVVYGIIQQHNGTIEVESTLDVGTRFTIQLPMIEDPYSPDSPSRQSLSSQVAMPQNALTTPI